ncbi:hypothetical protein CYMTET_12863 [Cymbomonas tetramitiformis]|uniref:Uncharacterized protein n=1 Tax=Cymbomonas tetramitiformis TaxID=36881 RepID=A0AAE0LBL9_9CHLO|nr:hypothetical protein CYMTET_12863 [Cymbomonas tetramitiformis]
MEREEGTVDEDPDSDLADLRTMVLDLKRQLAARADSDGSPPADRGFTPRAVKAGRQMKNRFAAKPLTVGGNGSQSTSKKVDFHRDTGGRRGISAYSFTDEAENSVLAAWFQHAIDHDNAEEFDAPCALAGGKPDTVADISACSFCEEDGDALVSAIDEYTDMTRHVDTGALHINTFTADVPVVSEPAKHCFSRRVETPDEPPVAMNMLSAIEEPESYYEPETYATSDSDDEGYPTDQPPASQSPQRSTGQWCWTGCLSSPNHGDTAA